MNEMKTTSIAVSYQDKAPIQYSSSKIIAELNACIGSIDEPHRDIWYGIITLSLKSLVPHDLQDKSNWTFVSIHYALWCLTKTNYDKN